MPQHGLNAQLTLCVSGQVHCFCGSWVLESMTIGAMTGLAACCRRSGLCMRHVRAEQSPHVAGCVQECQTDLPPMARRVASASSLPSLAYLLAPTPGSPESALMVGSVVMALLTYPAACSARPWMPL